MQFSSPTLDGSSKSASVASVSLESVPLREQLSALTDGEASWVSWSHLDAGYAESGELKDAWNSYHLIRDALQNSAFSAPITSDDFVAQVMSRVAQEPQRFVALSAVESPLAPLPGAPSANDPVFRWKMVAGFASMAAVMAVAWQMVSSPVVPTGQQLAVNPVAPDNIQLVVTPSGNVMIRDEQLDELMAAHRQWGGVSALQMPAGFLRSATYEPSQR